MSEFTPDTADGNVTTPQAVARTGGLSWTRRWAWGTLGLVIATILMGAVVRGTSSGDGCGRSWPACSGIPTVTGSGDSAQLIEFSHRAISGVTLLAMLVLAVLVFRTFRPKHPARRAVIWSVGLLIVEALIGAGIVLYGWVGEDRSTARQISVPLHLVNTFLLTGSTALTIWLVECNRPPRWNATSGRSWTLAMLAFGLLVVAATGATTSLADTLFGAEGSSLEVGDREALIVRLRILHPIAAIGLGLTLTWFATRHVTEATERGHPRAAWILIVGVTVQAGLGFVHIALLTPLITALLHLLFAEVLWLALAFLTFALLEPQPSAEHARPDPAVPAKYSIGF